MTETEDQFEITAHPQNAATARERIRHTALRMGFSRASLGDIEVAFGEAITNAILYGSPTGSSRILVITNFSPAENAFHIEVRDQGRGFDPSHMRQDENNTDALGGRGLRLMRALMDDVWLHYAGEGMVVRLTKKLD